MTQASKIIGADFSRYQRVIPAKECADAGIRFAWIKTQHGTSPDPMFASNWSATRGAFERGRGAYVFVTTSDPVLQAESTVRRLEATGDVGELFTAVDNEQVSEQLRDEALAVHVLKVLRRIRELSGNAVHYSGRWFLDVYMKPERVSSELLDELASFPYWHAEYPRTVLVNRRACGVSPPALSAPHLPRMYLARGIVQAVWQFDGDGGCILPNGVDADFDIATEEGLARTSRTPHPATVPAPAPVDDMNATIPDAPSPIRKASSQRLPAVRVPICLDPDDEKETL